EKADALDRYFASIFRSNILNSHSPPLSAYSQNALDSISVSTEDVNNLFMCQASLSSTDKAIGPDRLLKECSDEITPSLTARALQQGTLTLQSSSGMKGSQRCSGS
ncbi:Hypothetical predicted protein, partial [Paramuricea clavata]